MIRRFCVQVHSVLSEMPTPSDRLYEDKAKWIWVESASKPDSYGEFYDEFIWEDGDVNCCLSCDGDYTLFVNGQYVASNQYGDFEWYKSYDCIDITPYLTSGKNTIAILVWHFGVNSQRYLKAQAGVIFELVAEGKVLLASGEATRARYSRTYAHGIQKLVTRQLGFSFSYDATKEDAPTTVKVMWNQRGLYFLAIVTDSSVVSYDRINFWVSEYFIGQAGTYSDEGNYHVCVTPDGQHYYYTGTDVSGHGKLAAQQIATGYVVEVYMPIVGSEYLEAGNSIGLDISVDHYNETSDSRDYYGENRRG